ncbi:50S ribosomal protein L17 [Neochlamydia sp. EPS4]|uniref:50S ribosomal protein L17 n=1 Tax=unclassified Neochlamydia TaxID=2643326 RepID=UPI00057CAA90|nr:MULTISPECIES: 50S ribosomal protein L17 [unclassified Neochlamydia]KIC72753.1 50S ribosomal protein L17 [Neochlamydia sp. EPS4]KIC76804.1 50S ribosomal protein L17 [Neochlamydia sp. TUME1]
MRHRKDTCKLSRTSSHRRCMFANMLKSLIENERIETTVPKAKALRRYADKMITLAKKNTLATRRRAISEMMVRFNALTDKEARAARKGDTSAYNTDRQVIDKLFSVLGPRFASRAGGYTRIVKAQRRVGDNTQMCIIEYLDN